MANGGTERTGALLHGVAFTESHDRVTGAFGRRVEFGKNICRFRPSDSAAWPQEKHRQMRMWQYGLLWPPRGRQYCEGAITAALANCGQDDGIRL